MPPRRWKILINIMAFGSANDDAVAGEQVEFRLPERLPVNLSNESQVEAEMAPAGIYMHTHIDKHIRQSDKEGIPAKSAAVS